MPSSKISLEDNTRQYEEFLYQIVEEILEETVNYSITLKNISKWKIVLWMHLQPLKPKPVIEESLLEAF